MIKKTSQIQHYLLGAALAFFAPYALGDSANDAPAYKIDGKTVSISDLMKKDETAFYEIEKKKYDLIFDKIREEYLDKFWSSLSKSKGDKAQEEYKQAYIKSKIKISDSEIKEMMKKFKDHPQLAKLSEDERKKQIREYLVSRETQKVFDKIIEDAIKSKKLVILYPKPKEPVYNISVSDQEPVRYGPKTTDTKPIGCKGDQCPITVVEYSEYQCPFCDRMLPDTTKVLEAYKGKIRWIVRDFPLEFHPRAIPAAVAAKCAHFQGKFWDMYYSIFQNQKELSDADLIKRAESLKLDMKKFNECYNTPKDTKAPSDWKKANDMIQDNISSGAKIGVRGTPAFFVEGKMLSGALPFEEFKKVIDEELANKKAL